MKRFIFLLLMVGSFFGNVVSEESEKFIDVDEHERVFTWIYDTAVWGKNDQGEGFSGGGSRLANTGEYIAYLEKFMKDHNIKSVVDVGCGDWEFSRYIDWSGINYIGYDVVAHVIEKNRKSFGSSSIQFIHGNFLYVDLPEADLLLCKHVLQHLSNADIINFLKQLKKFKYCLITNEVNPETLSSLNPDIEIGGGRKVDLSKPPFNIFGEKVLSYRLGRPVHQVFLIDNTK